jgi:uncharacterized damage-inducible protein DinB
MSSGTAVLSPAELLEHWQGLRNLSRRVIEVFPDEHLFTYSVGGMRPFALLAGEMIAIAAPMAREIVTGETLPYEDFKASSKAELLERWDAETAELIEWFSKVPPERFSETITVFGQYTGTVWSHFFYAIDNENHHRGQGYVYLRALGVEPPPFWERGASIAA